MSAAGTRRVVAKPTERDMALATVRRFAEDLSQAELEVAKARARLVTAISAAVRVATKTDVAAAAGVTRQRIQQLVRQANGV